MDKMFLHVHQLKYLMVIVLVLQLAALVILVRVN